jgi:hypothetical protein
MYLPGGFNMKKICAAVLVGLLAAIAPLNLAQADVVAAQQSQPAPIAYIVNATTGQRYALPVLVYTEDLGNGNFVTTYAVPVSFDSPNLIPNVVPANTKSDCHMDTSYSVNLCINAYYSERWYGSQYTVSIDHYSYQWNRLDSQVSWSGAYDAASCFGYFEPHSNGVCSANQRNNIGSPSSGSWYSLYPSWRGQYVDISSTSYQVGNIYVHLTRNQTQWNFGWCMSVGGGGYGGGASGCY